MMDKWENYVMQNAEMVAIANWNQAFPNDAAYQALLAKYSPYVSAERKAEAQIWLEANPDEVQETEWGLSCQFEERYEEGTAQMALSIKEGESTPEALLQAVMWAKAHRDEMREAEAARVEQWAIQFGAMFASDEEAAEKLLELRRIGESTPMSTGAEAWGAYHMAAVTEAEELATTAASTKFEEQCPDRTAVAAVQELFAPTDFQKTLGAEAWKALHETEVASAKEVFAVELEEKGTELKKAIEGLKLRLQKLTSAAAAQKKQKKKKRNHEQPDKSVEKPGETPGHKKALTARGGVKKTTKQGQGAGKAARAQDKHQGASVSGAAPQTKSQKGGGATSTADGTNKVGAASNPAEPSASTTEAGDAEVEVSKAKIKEVEGLLLEQLEEQRRLLGLQIVVLQKKETTLLEDNSAELALRDDSLRPSEAEEKHRAIMASNALESQQIAKKMETLQAAQELCQAQMVELGWVEPSEEERTQYYDDQAGAYTY
ncbi:unnamed protein product [Chrysoparadoxa australica]